MNHSSTIKDFPIRGKIFKIDIGLEDQLGIYGESFWRSIAVGDYEKITFDYIDWLSAQGYDYFIDIGAATGCMTLYASAQSLKVLSIEPQKAVFDALTRNLELNELLCKNVSQLFALVVPDSNQVNLNESFTPGAFGPISEGGLSEQAISLESLINGIPYGSKVALKIDIEGAEFPLFARKSTLNYLSNRKPLIYIALHPGFKKPLKGNANFISRFFWRIQAFQDVLAFFVSLSTVAELQLASSRRKIGLFGLVFALAKDEKDFLLIF